MGNLCGVNNPESGMDMTSKPFQYMLDPWNGFNAYKICVESCPEEVYPLTNSSSLS
jgi:NAD-dependent dihydropyrimidine dehydrogenase PreA subunit